MANGIVLLIVAVIFFWMATAPGSKEERPWPLWWVGFFLRLLPSPVGRAALFLLGIGMVFLAVVAFIAA